MTKQIAAISFIVAFLVSLMAIPSFASSDTTTTETGAQVEQTITIAPPSDSGNSLDPDDGGVSTRGDVVSIDNNQGGDSIVVTINPTEHDSTEEAIFHIPDYLAISSNVEFDINVKAHSDHTDGDGDGTVDLIYSGKEADPAKPVTDAKLDLIEIDGDDRDAKSIDDAEISVQSEYKVAGSAIPAGKYFNNDEGLEVTYTINKTTPSSMPTGFYKLKLVWEVVKTDSGGGVR